MVSVQNLGAVEGEGRSSGIMKKLIITIIKTNVYAVLCAKYSSKNFEYIHLTLICRKNNTHFTDEKTMEGGKNILTSTSYVISPDV